MNRIKIAAAAVSLCLAALALIACGAQPAAIAAVKPTATVFAPPPTDIPPPPPEATPSALDFPLPAPKHVEHEAADDEACVVCHTSEETLKALAKAEEEPAVESEGEG